MRITIRGEVWRLVTVDAAAFPDDRVGDCDCEARLIRVLRGLSDAERLRVVVHELLHAHAWSWPERRVDDVSTQIASTLRRLGWRSRSRA